MNNIPVYNEFIARGWVRRDTRVADIIKKTYLSNKKAALLTENPELIFHLEAVLNMRTMRERDKTGNRGSVMDYVTILRSHGLENLLRDTLFASERASVLKDDVIKKEIEKIS